MQNAAIGKPTYRGTRTLSEMAMFRHSVLISSQRLCDLMSHMKALVAGFVLLMSGYGTAQDVDQKQKNSQCVVVLKVEAIMYASAKDEKDEKIDSLTVCDDGKATTAHSFTAPAFGTIPPEPTNWEHSGEIDKDAQADLKKIVRRTDIVHLPARINAIKNPSPVDLLMRFTIFDRGTERTVSVNVPYRFCGVRPEMPHAAWDLICVFIDLWARAKTGNPPSDNDCGCKSLDEMAVGQDPGVR